MLQLNKGLITPARSVDGSFETVKAKAFEDSDYDHNVSENDSSAASPEEESGQFDVIFGLLIMALPIVAIIAIFVLRSRKKKLRDLYNNAGYFREAPISGNIEATYVLADEFSPASDDGNIIGAAFLKLINAGCLEPLTEKAVGLFGQGKREHIPETCSSS